MQLSKVHQRAVFQRNSSNICGQLLNVHECLWGDSWQKNTTEIGHPLQFSLGRLFKAEYPHLPITMHHHGNCGLAVNLIQWGVKPLKRFSTYWKSKQKSAKNNLALGSLGPAKHLNRKCPVVTTVESWLSDETTKPHSWYPYHKGNTSLNQLHPSLIPNLHVALDLQWLIHGLGCSDSFNASAPHHER